MLPYDVAIDLFCECASENQTASSQVNPVHTGGRQKRSFALTTLFAFCCILPNTSAKLSGDFGAPAPFKYQPYQYTDDQLEMFMKFASWWTWIFICVWYVKIFFDTFREFLSNSVWHDRIFNGVSCTQFRPPPGWRFPFRFTPLWVTVIGGFFVCLAISVVNPAKYGSPRPIMTVEYLRQYEWFEQLLQKYLGNAKCFDSLYDEEGNPTTKVHEMYCYSKWRPIKFEIAYVWVLYVQTMSILWLPVLSNLFTRVCTYFDDGYNILALFVEFFCHLYMEFLPVVSFWMIIVKITISSADFYAQAWTNTDEPEFGDLLLVRTMGFVWHATFGAFWLGAWIFPKFLLGFYTILVECGTLFFALGGISYTFTFLCWFVFNVTYATLLLGGPVVVIYCAWKTPVRRIRRWAKPPRFSPLKPILAPFQIRVTVPGTKDNEEREKREYFSLEDRRKLTASSIKQDCHLVGAPRDFQGAGLANYHHCGVSRDTDIQSPNTSACLTPESYCRKELPNYFDLTQYAYPLSTILDQICVESYALMFDSNCSSFMKTPGSGGYSLTSDHQYDSICCPDNSTITVPHYALKNHGHIRQRFGSLRYETVSRIDGLKLVRFLPEFVIGHADSVLKKHYRFDSNTIFEGDNSYTLRSGETTIQVIPKALIHNVATRTCLMPRSDPSTMYNVSINYVRSAVDSSGLTRCAIHYWALLSIRISDELAVSASTYQSSMIDNPMNYSWIRIWYYRSWVSRINPFKYFWFDDGTKLGYVPWDFRPVYVPTYSVNVAPINVVVDEVGPRNAEQPFPEVCQDVIPAVVDDASTGPCADELQCDSVDGAESLEPHPDSTSSDYSEDDDESGPESRDVLSCAAELSIDFGEATVDLRRICGRGGARIRCGSRGRDAKRSRSRSPVPDQAQERPPLLPLSAGFMQCLTYTHFHELLQFESDDVTVTMRARNSELKQFLQQLRNTGRKFRDNQESALHFVQDSIKRKGFKFQVSSRDRG